MIPNQETQPINATAVLTDKEIFTKIWTTPRLVFKYLNDTKYDKYVPILLFFAGIVRAVDRAAGKNMGDGLSLVAILALCVILGGSLGWISYYLYAILLRWTGKWLKGQAADTKSLLRVLSYAAVPSIVTLVLLIPQIAVFGNSIFQSEIDIFRNMFSTVVFISTFILEIVLSIWSVVLLVVGLSEVQKKSIGKSIINMLLPLLLILVPIILIAVGVRFFIN